LAPAAIGLLASFCSFAAQGADAGTLEKKISARVVRSRCADYVWQDRRGRAPIGYVKGVAITYAKSFAK
jgi:hypothetical protein